MRKLITLLLAAVLALSLCACTAKQKEYPSTGSDLSWEEIQSILAEMEAEEEAKQ